MPAAKRATSKTVKQAFRNRNPQTGLYDDVDYPKTEDGFIDWEALIPSRYIKPNKEAVKRNRGIDVDSLSEEDLEKLLPELENNEKLILLQGFKWLAKFRGYTNCECRVDSTENGARANCVIDWIPNVEEPESVGVRRNASANPYTVKGELFQNYCEAIAENRAFIRVVKDSLGIQSYGQDEFVVDTDKVGLSGDSSDTVVTAKPSDLLKSTCENHNISFVKLKSTINKTNPDWQPEDWNSFEDVPQDKVFQIVSRIKKKAKES